MSAKDLAQRVDVSPRTLADWESGSTEPAACKVAALATVLDVSADYLLGRVDAELGIEPGTWIIDLDALEARKGAWCVRVPRRYRLVDYDEMRRLEDNRES